MALTNWAGNYAYRAPRFVQPTSVAQVQHLVAATDHVRALGSRHCFNDLADTTGTLIHLGLLPREVSVDTAAAAVQVDGGIRYGDLVAPLDRAGLALANLASLPHISVAGACATATHGSGNNNQNLATQVRELDLVTAEGDVVTLRRGDTDFVGAVVGLGALGLVTRMVLDVVPTYDVATRAYAGLAWSTMLDHLPEILAAGYSVSIAPNWQESATCTVFVKERLETNQHSPDPSGARAADLFGAPAATVKLHPSPGVDPVACTEQLGVPGPWHARLPHFKLEYEPSTGNELQSEYLVPRPQAVAALAAVHGVADRLARWAQSTEIRSVSADDLWLSPGYGVDLVGLHFTWVNDQPEIEALLPSIEQRLRPFGARPHWGKLYATSADELAGLFPRLADFADLVDRFDPRGKFANTYLDTILARVLPQPA